MHQIVAASMNRETSDVWLSCPEISAPGLPCSSRTVPQTRRAPPGTQMSTSRLQTRDGLTGVEVSTAPGPPRRRRDSWRRIDKGPTGPGPPRGRSKHIYVHGLRSSAPVTATATATASPSAPPTSAAPPRRAAGSPTIRAAAGGPRCSAAAGRRNSRRSHNHNRPTTAGTSPPAARRVPSPTSAGAASGPTRPGGWRSAGTGTSRAAAGSRSHQDSCPSHNLSTQASQQQLATAAAAFQNARSFFEAAPHQRPPKTPPAWRRRAGSAPSSAATTSRARRAARRRRAQIFVEEAAGSGPGGCRSAGPPCSGSRAAIQNRESRAPSLDSRATGPSARPCRETRRPSLLHQSCAARRRRPSPAASVDLFVWVLVVLIAVWVWKHGASW